MPKLKSFAQFPTGKKYNADLNDWYNIGARYWAYKLKLAYRNGSQLPGGKSSTSIRRIPVTLSRLVNPGMGFGSFNTASANLEGGDTKQ